LAHEDALLQVYGQPVDVAPSETLHLLLATSRPAIVAFFESLGRDGLELDVELIDVDLEPLARRAARLGNAAAAVVDVGIESAAGIAVCRELARLQPALPVIAVFCCPHAVTPWTIRELLAVGVSSVIDLQTRAEEVLRLLSSSARGGSMLHLHLRRDQRAILGEILTTRRQWRELELRLLELVTLGIPDQEIGRRLHLSPHTVKHYIEHLRTELRVRNRIELAAWAGRQGLYSPNGAVQRFIR
jgi:DNA-binding NarL/FixJ family response regulator